MGAPFDGERFSNPGVERRAKATLGAFVRWRWTRTRGAWRTIESEPGPPPPRRVDRGLRVTFVGHASVLIQQDGLNLLTDPIWSERCSPVGWAGPRRYRPPGIRFDDLPPIDAVLISHNHYDHLDVPTLRSLARRDRPLAVAPLGNRAWLERRGISPAIEMNWWDGHQLGDDCELVCVPAQHFSGRTLRDRNRTLWGGYVIRSPSATVYFAGDTGAGPQFAEIRERIGAPDVALLPIGAYEPRWFMKMVHLSPADAVQAHVQLGARESIGIHFGTFELSDESQEQPVADLHAALADTPEARGAFSVLAEGEGRTIVGARLSGAAPRTMPR